MIGRRGPPCRVGGVALLGQGWLARGGGEGDGPARAGGLGQQGGELGRQVARGVGLRPQFDHRRGEAHQVHRVQQMGVQHRLALGGYERGDVAEAGEAGRGRGGLGGGRRGRKRGGRGYAVARVGSGGVGKLRRKPPLP